MKKREKNKEAWWKIDKQQWKMMKNRENKWKMIKHMEKNNENDEK
jgi:hypothetical protein